jgi:uncharacterized membrane protein YkvI
MPRWFRVYLVPGAVFQSIIVGGGYGTGRELVEYFVQYGIAGAFKGLLVATLLFAIILAFTFEFARVFQAFDYRSFLRRLIGPVWPLFEVNYLLSVVLVLAVVASASAEITERSLGLPGIAGGGLMLVLIVVLNFFGRDVMKNVFSAWSLVLYVVFGIFLVALVATQSDNIAEGLTTATSDPNWPGGAIAYVGYNVGAGIIALFAIRDLRSRREAIGSGAMAALIAMVPAVMFTIGFAAGYPAIIDQPVPNYFMLGVLDAPWITVLFLIVLLGTFVETGAGMIQGVNERFDGWLMERRGRPATRRAHGMLALVALSLSGGMSTFGVITLVEKGYGLMAWGGILFYVIPLAIIGPWRLWREAQTADASPEAPQA